MKKMVRKLVESALMIAVATVLSLLKIDLPFGGGVTIVSMLPLILISHRYGWKWGVLTAFVYSLIQLILGLDNVAYAENFLMGVGIVLLDYVIAYTVIGLSGVFGKKFWSVVVGVAVTFTLRFLCHLVTGAWLPMTNPWIYSFLYNGWYMLLELIITEVVVCIIYWPLKKYFTGSDLGAAK